MAVSPDVLRKTALVLGGLWLARKVFRKGKRVALLLPGANLDPAVLAAHPKLVELHPVFAPKVARVIAAMERRGFRPYIPDPSGWRSRMDQLKELLQGDSTVAFSFHNATLPDGTPAALGVDVVDRWWAWGAAAKTNGYWDALEQEANREGLVTGNSWRTHWDPAHIQPWAPGGGQLAEVKAGWTPKAADFA